MGLRYKKYSLIRGVHKVKTKTAIVLSAVGLLVGSGGGLSFAILGTSHADAPAWKLNPSSITFTCGGTAYPHSLNTVTENQATGDFTGTGNYVTDPSYTWDTTGNVSGSNIAFQVVYTGSNAGYTLNGVGTIASDGSVSGTVDNNCESFAMPAGTATHFTTPTQVVVTPPLNSQGWSTADSTSGGVVSFNNDATAPGNPHNGALELTTDSTAAAKAQYMHAANTPLAGVNELSYSTKQTAPAGVVADASYQMPVLLNGTSGFTTLVYEPYQGGQGAVVNGQWQSWDIASGGLFWSTRSVTCSNGTINGTSGGPAVYTLAQVKAACPDAIVTGFGVNIGSNNPSYDVEADLVDFNGTVYNFEPYAVATDKDACKNDGWKTLRAADGSSFRNQGLCVSYVASNGKSQH